MEIKSPWTLVYMEYVDDLIRQIKEALPPDHPLQQHEIIPGIKRERRLLFIVDDNTTGQRILMDFEKKKRWKKTKYRVPTMRVFKDEDEIQALIERDHQEECAEFAEMARRAEDAGSKSNSAQ
jgi:hypothetical protein